MGDILDINVTDKDGRVINTLRVHKSADIVSIPGSLLAEMAIAKPGDAAKFRIGDFVAVTMNYVTATVVCNGKVIESKFCIATRQFYYTVFCSDVQMTIGGIHPVNMTLRQPAPVVIHGSAPAVPD